MSDNPSHPSFRLEIDVSKYYERKALDNFIERIGGVVKLALGDENVVKLSDGRLAAISHVEGERTFDVAFMANGITREMDDRDAAKALEDEHFTNGVAFTPVEILSFNASVADHIRRAAMLPHAKTEHFEAIRVYGLPEKQRKELQTYLNAVFETEDTDQEAMS